MMAVHTMRQKITMLLMMKKYLIVCVHEYSIYILSQYTYIIASDIVSITAELSDVEADFSPFSCCTSALFYLLMHRPYPVVCFHAIYS